MKVEQISANKCFGGQQLRLKHHSNVLDCEMNFAVYLPPQADSGPVPVLYWLSGLTCTDENFVTKAGAQKYAAQEGIALIVSDTSPRGEDVPDAPDNAYDLGLGAGFYVNATQPPWRSHYRMYDYVVDELYAMINENFPVDSTRVGISGHSMGGHGALTIALNNPGKYLSVSAFSPIVSPLNCPWGQKALGHYIGDNKTDWARYDTTELVRSVPERLPVLIDQGEADDFLETQLKTELLMQASKDADYPMQIRFHPGYDHSYFFIASFIEDHIRFHGKNISA